MTFAYPKVLFLLLLVPMFIALAVASVHRAQRKSEQIVARRHHGRLLTGTSTASRWIPTGLFLLGFTMALLALARPQWGFFQKEDTSEGRDILIAMDVSRSMLAPDLLPDRLTRAKLVAEDLVRTSPGDRFGVIAFAGRAFMQAPLTIDHEAVSETVAQLDIYTIPRGGTNLGDALDLSVKTFAKAEAETAGKALILFSDGDDLEGTAREAAKKAKEAGIIVVAIGVGTPQGDVIPDPEISGDFVKDPSGKVVRSRLKRASLEEIARSTSGIYIDIGSPGSTRSAITRAIENLERSRSVSEGSRQPIERYQWPLLSAFIAIALGFLSPFFFSPRQAFPPAATALLVAVFLSPPDQGHAAIQVRDHAHTAYEKQDYTGAVEQYNSRLEKAPGDGTLSRSLNFGLGASAYRGGDFTEAAQAFGKALLSQDSEMRENAHYNLGNTFFRNGKAAMEEALKAMAKGNDKAPPLQAFEQVIKDWEDSIGHYEATLAISPGNEDAAFNRDVVQRHLDKLKKMVAALKKMMQMQQDGKGGKNSKKNRGKSRGEKGNPGEGENGEEGEEGKGDRDNPMEKGKGGQGDKPENLEGKLEAATGGSGQERGGQKGVPNENIDRRIDPETGYSPSQARQLLEQFADEEPEESARREPPTNQPYKDW